MTGGSYNFTGCFCSAGSKNRLHVFCVTQYARVSALDNDSSGSFLVRHEFLIRRLHSLSGLVPVGAYMVVHLLTNATVLNGVATFQDAVDRIHSLGVVLPAVEWGFIFLPILFHAVVGIAIIGRLPDTTHYPYRENFRYLLQRTTAWIALVFIGWHVFQMHGWLKNEWWLSQVAQPLGGAKFDPHHASTSAAAALAPLWVQAIYAVGMLATVYHLANGIWTAGITWGLWISPPAQRRASVACLIFGVLLGGVGLSAISGMTRINRPENYAGARAVEDVRIEQHEQRQQAIEQRKEELLEHLEAADAQTASRPKPSAD